MKINRKILFLLMVATILFSSLVVSAKDLGSNIKWVSGPKIMDSKDKKIDVYGKLDVPHSYKGNTKVKLEINGFNVNLNKDGTFKKSIFKTSIIEIKVFTGKYEIPQLRRIIKYGMDNANVNEVIKLIEKIPNINELKLEDKNIVTVARARYNSLLPEEKELVTNYYKLVAAENKIKELEAKAPYQELIKEAEKAILALPSFEDIRIKHKESVLAAIAKVEKIKKINPTIVIKGEQLLSPLLDKIKYLESEAANNYFFPAIYSNSPEQLGIYSKSQVLFEGYVTNVKYLEKVLIDNQKANVEFVENAVVKSGSTVVYTGPAYKFSKTLVLEDKSQAISINVISQSGKSGSIAKRFYVDTTPPELKILVKDRDVTSNKAEVEITMKDMFGYLRLYEFDSNIFTYDKDYSQPVTATITSTVYLEIGENVIPYSLIDAAGNETIKEIIIIREESKPIVKRKVQISLFKDSTSSSNRIDFTTISNFYIKNKETGKIYRDGSAIWNNKSTYVMNEIPVGEYSIHFDLPTGMYTESILLGDSYKETIYNEKTNPLVVIDRGTTANYVKIVLKSNLILKEIKPLNQLTVSKYISLADFIAALPKQTTVVASDGKEYKVNLTWQINTLQFESYKKAGQATLYSNFFTLPINVSNTVPATRLEVTIRVIFQ